MSKTNTAKTFPRKDEISELKDKNKILEAENAKLQEKLHAKEAEVLTHINAWNAFENSLKKIKKKYL